MLDGAVPTADEILGSTLESFWAEGEEQNAPSDTPKTHQTQRSA
jgi:hypothetical protein